MRYLINLVKSILNKYGYQIRKKPPLGVDPFKDMQGFIKNKHPIILDAGANTGQTVQSFKEYFPGSIIHSFEPSPISFKKLAANCLYYKDVTAWNYAVGEMEGKLPFFENYSAVMSSLLEPSNEIEIGHTVNTIEVPVVSVDFFTEKGYLQFIDVLKIDVQGYELQVLKGAKKLMDENRIALIYFEYTFSNLYKGIPDFHEVYKFLSENNFMLVCFYEQRFINKVLGWTDFLFINKDFYKKSGH